MSQVSKYLRSGDTGYFHWCPACEEMHPLPKGWTFNGDVNCPTFTPSFKHSGVRREKVNGKWTGEWIRDAAGKPMPEVCHYFLTAGVLNFCADCTHELAGKSVPLPELPPGYTDSEGSS